MSTTRRFLAITAAATALAGCSSMGGNGGATKSPTQKQANLAANATTVLQRQMAQPSQKRIPQELIADARCVAVFPKVTEAGLIVGGHHGDGFVSCRQKSGGLGSAAPAIFSLSGGSIGLQAGAQQNTLILLFMTQQAVQTLFQPKVKFGTQLGITAGPVGFNRSIQGTAAPVLSYISNKKGLFGGVNLNGTKLSYNDSENAPLYGQGATARGVLIGNLNIPSTLTQYTQTLQRFAPTGGSSSQQQNGNMQQGGGMQGSGQHNGGMQQGGGMQGSGQGNGGMQQGGGMQGSGQGNGGMQQNGGMQGSGQGNGGMQQNGGMQGSGQGNGGMQQNGGMQGSGQGNGGMQQGSGMQGSGQQQGGGSTQQ